MERLKESIRTMKQLYSIIIGLALAESLLKTFAIVDSDPFDPTKLLWLFALISLILPFHHGALRHLDDAYLWTSTPPKKGALLLDYLVLFIEAGLLFTLAIFIHEPHNFLLVLVLLLSLDVLWGAISYFITHTFGSGVWKWVVINLGAILIIVLIEFTPLLDGLMPQYIVFLLYARAIADYLWAWEFYFPDMNH